MQYLKTHARRRPFLITTAARLGMAGLLCAVLAACGTAPKPAPGATAAGKSANGASSASSAGTAASGSPLSPSSRSAAATPSAKAKGKKAPKSAATARAAAPKTPARSAGALAGTLTWPASGTVTARFNGGSSKGIDIAGRPGDPVVAASAGRVVFAGSTMRGYGNLVMLKHGDDLLTAYAHNRKLLVKENQSVKAGQQIAEMGNTDSNATKLHFELRRAGQAVDPLPYLQARGAAPAP